MSDLVDDVRDDAPEGGNVEPFIERQLERLGKTLIDSIDRLEQHIEERAAQLAAPRIAAAEQRAAEAEQRAERAEKAHEQRLGDLRAELVRQMAVLERRNARLWWLSQHLPGPLLELVGPVPVKALEGQLPEEWRAMVARRAAPGFDPAAEAERGLLSEAVTMAVFRQTISATSVQRKLRVGFATAQRLMQRMEDLAVVGPVDGRGRRRVLVTPDALPGLLASLGAGKPAEREGQR